MSRFELPKEGPRFAFIMATNAGAFSGAAIYTTWMVIELGVGGNVPALFIITCAAALPISWAVGAVIGLPVTWLLSALNLESLPAYLGIGLLTGYIVISQLLSGWFLPTNSNTALEFVTIGGLPGAISGSVWWLMNRRDSVRSKTR